MSTITLTADNQFTAVSGCAVSGGSVGLTDVIDNFNDNSFDTSIWNKVDPATNITEQNQRIEIDRSSAVWNVAGVIRKAAITRAAGTSFRLKFYVPAVQEPFILIGFNRSATVLDWDDPNSFALAYLAADNGFYVYGSDAGAGTDTTYNGVPGNWYTARVAFKAAGFKVYVQSDDDANYATETLVYESSSDTNTTWYAYFQQYSGDGYYDDAALVYDTGIASVHDAGETYIDAGDGQSLDFSTFSVSSTGSPTLRFRYDSSADSGHSPSYGSWLTLAQLQAESNTDHRYLWLQVEIDGDPDDTLDEITVDTYSTDASAPTGMTALRGIQDLVSDYQLLNIAGTTGSDEEGGSGLVATTIEIRSGGTWHELLDDGTSQAAGTAADPTDLYEINGGDVADTFVACVFFTDDATTKSLIDAADLMRLVCWDALDNHAESASISITELVTDIPDRANVLTTDTVDGEAGRYDATNIVPENVKAGVTYGVDSGETGTLSGGEAPSTPVLTVTDKEDGTGATATVSGADAGTTNSIRVALLPDGDFSEEGTITGNGDVDLTLDAGKYVAVVISDDAATSDPVEFIVTGGGTYVSPEEAIRTILEDDADTYGQVGSRIYPQAAPIGSAYPLIVFQRITTTHYRHTTGISGFADASVQVDYYAKTYAKAKELAEYARLALDGYSGTKLCTSGQIGRMDIRLDSDNDEHNDVQHDGNNVIYRVSHQFSVTHQEVTNA